MLAITARGNDCVSYVPHAQPGQIWGDDTHPEMGHKLVRSLRGQGVKLFKVFNTGGARFVPRLPGFPSHTIPGCLLMALTQVACKSHVARKQYDEFHTMAEQMGFTIALAHHNSWFE